MFFARVASRPVSENLCGRILGELELREQLDEGGHGVVYLCDQPSMRRQAVVKVLHQGLRNDDLARERFLREAHLASRLDHPFAAHIYAYGVEPDDGIAWIAMEFVHGEPLSRRLYDRGPMTLEQAVHFFEHVAEVVQAAHDRGIIHRDLKASNIMVFESKGRLYPKLLDFGIAKLRQDAALSSSASDTTSQAASRDSEVASSAASSDSTRPCRSASSSGSLPAVRLTRAGVALGTPPYMSPEQWDDPASVGPASDLYALGVVLYEAVTGRRPFDGATTGEYSEFHRSAPVPPLGSEFPASLDRFFARALAKRPEDRFHNAIEFARALRVALRAHLPAQLQQAAQQWDERARPRGLLWRGDALVELQRWTRRTSASALPEPQASFVAASWRDARRVAWVLRAVGVLALALAFGSFQVYAALSARRAKQSAAFEVGREALLHDEMSDARQRLAEAYRLGVDSPAIRFMLSRAIQPALAERVRFGVQGRIWWSVFSPDGRRVATGEERSATLWDASSGRKLAVLPHADSVYQVMFVSGGAQLVTACGDGAVRVWDIASGKLLRELRRPYSTSRAARYFAAAVSPDDQFLAAVDMDGAIAHVWNMRDGTFITELEVDGHGYPSVAFSHDGRQLAVSGGDVVRVVDAELWTSRVALAGHNVRALAFDPNTSRLATGSSNGDISLWDPLSGDRVQHLREVGDAVDRVAFAPSGEFLATASRDGTEEVWRADGRLQSRGNWLHGKVQSIEFDAASGMVVAGGSSGQVVIVDALMGIPVVSYDGPDSLVRAVHFDPVSKLVLGAWDDGSVRTWSASPSYRRWTSSTVADNCAAYGDAEPDARYSVIACSGHEIRVWDTGRGTLVAELPGVAGRVDDSAPPPVVSQDGRLAAVARGDIVEMYDLSSATVVQRVQHRAAVTSIALGGAGGHGLLSGDLNGVVMLTVIGSESREVDRVVGGVDVVGFAPGSTVFVATSGAHLRLVALRGEHLVADRTMPTRARLLRLSPDKRRLVTVPSLAGATGYPVLWNASDLGEIARMEGHHGRVQAARFAARGTLLTAGNDGAVRLWDADSGEALREFHGGSRTYTDAAASSDGSMVIGAGADGRIRFWDVETGAPLWSMKAHVSAVMGLSVEGDDVVTRASSGDLARWSFPSNQILLMDCDARSVACGIISR